MLNQTIIIPISGNGDPNILLAFWITLNFLMSLSLIVKYFYLKINKKFLEKDTWDKKIFLESPREFRGINLPTIGLVLINLAAFLVYITLFIYNLLL